MRTAAVLLRAALTAGALALPLAVYTVTARPARATSEVVRPVGGFVMTDVPLTASQEARVREINRRYAAERRTIAGRDSTRAADPALTTALFRNVDAMIAEERALLTPAQRVPFDRNVARILTRRRALGA